MFTIAYVYNFYFLNFLTDYFHFCEFPVQPVAVYPFNNKTLANDVSLNKGTGKTLGTTFSRGINGEPGGSIEVHGRRDSHITLYNNHDILDTKVSITILLHVYPYGSKGAIVNYKIDGNGVQMYATDKYGAWTLGARINPRDPSSLGSEVYAAKILQKNKWQFIGVTYNGSTSVVKLWHDGRVVASLWEKSITQIATQFDVRVGARDTDYFHGRVACLQFYSTALTKGQIDNARIACKPCK